MKKIKIQSIYCLPTSFCDNKGYFRTVRVFCDRWEDNVLYSSLSLLLIYIWASQKVANGHGGQTGLYRCGRGSEKWVKNNKQKLTNKKPSLEEGCSQVNQQVTGSFAWGAVSRFMDRSLHGRLSIPVMERFASSLCGKGLVIFRDQCHWDERSSVGFPHYCCCIKQFIFQKFHLRRIWEYYNMKTIP